MKFGFGIGLVTAVFLVLSAETFAGANYVGTNLDSKTNLSFGMSYSRTKKSFSPSRKTGSIGKFLLKIDYSVDQERWPADLVVGFDLPIFWADKNATSRNNKFNFGNTSFSASMGARLSPNRDDPTWGYLFKFDLSLPTCFEIEALALQQTNVPLDLIRYGRGWASALPSFTAFTENGVVLLKLTVGFAYSYIVKKSAAATSAGRKDQNRFNIPIQTAFTYKMFENLSINAEYNTMILDRPTKKLVKVSTKNSRFRQFVTPSVSVNFDNGFGQVYFNIPVDAASRRTQIATPGVVLGMNF